MGRIRKPLDPLRQWDYLLECFEKEPPGWRRDRLLALKLALSGKENQAVADLLGYSQATVQTWINKFRKGGVEELLQKGKGIGPPSQLTPEMEAAMTAELEKGVWRTAKDAWKWLSENYDVSNLKQSVIYKYLGKCGGRLKATRPFNPKKNQAAEDEFRVTLAEKIEAFDLPPGRNVRLWVYDEMRYGLMPLTRKMWCRRGIRAIAPSRREYKNGYLYGALEVSGTGSEFLLSPNVNKDVDKLFLDQVAKSDSNSIHIVIGDGAGFHHKENAGELPENIRIITLPSYCPELNPAEKLWDIIKDGICNKNWESLRKLEDAIIEGLHPFWEDPKRVASLIGSSYLVSELNDI